MLKHIQFKVFAGEWSFCFNVIGLANKTMAVGDNYLTAAKARAACAELWQEFALALGAVELGRANPHPVPFTEDSL